MANTVNILGYANTFGDWIVATNADSNEINSIGKYDWTKDSGTLYLNGTGTGLSVANNTIISGQLLVTGTSSSATIDNNLTVGKQVYFTNTTQTLTASGLIYANGTVYAGNTGTGLAVSNNTVMGGTLLVSGTANVQNTLVVLKSADLQNTLTVGGDTTITGNVGVSASIYTNLLQSNTLIRSSSASVSGVTYTNTLQANTNVLTDTIQSNTSINTITSYATKVQSNTSVNTAILSVTGNSYASYVNANNSVTTPSLTVTNINANNNNTGTAYFNQVYANNVYAAGNFVISGSTVYNATTLTLSADTPVPTTAALAVYRGAGANAVIQWSNTANYWSILDVNNPTLLTQYSQIMTANMISDSTTSTSTTTVPTNKVLTGAFLQANAAFNQANNAGTFAQPAFIQANSAYAQANTATTNAAAASSYANSAFAQANNAGTFAQPAFIQANAAFLKANTPDFIANSAALYANGAFAQANAAFIQANAAATLVSSGGTINGALNVIGNLQVSGSASYINVATFQTVDSLIELAGNNTSDTIDIGFYGQYVSTGTKYTGLVRTAASNYALFQGITTNPTSNSIGAITFANYATLNANIAAGQITSTQPIPITSGGTGVTTSTGSGSVVLSTSPTLVTPILGTPQSGNFSTGTFTWPTFNQNTTGTAAGLSATLAVGSGGTGTTTSTGTGSLVLSDSANLTGILTVNTIIGVASVGVGGNVIIRAGSGSGLGGNVIISGGDSSGSQGQVLLGDWGSSASGKGSVYVGANSKMYVLNTTNATATNTGALVVSGGIGANNDIWAGGTITAYSDARIKTNIVKISNALEKIEQLNGYTFDRTDRESSRQTGVIAQEVLKVLPEAVLGTEDTIYSVAYGNMVGLMIEAVKELNQKVKILESEIEELKRGK